MRRRQNSLPIFVMVLNPADGGSAYTKLAGLRQNSFCRGIMISPLLVPSCGTQFHIDTGELLIRMRRKVKGKRSIFAL